MTLLIRQLPASQFLDRGSSTTYSSHVANQRTNISSIYRRYRWPRRVDLSGCRLQTRHPVSPECGTARAY